MQQYFWVALAGVVGTFLIVYQNRLSSQDTRVELEERLRERLGGRGNRKGGLAVAVDEIRVTPLSRWAKVKWYVGRGVDSSVEVKVETNALITDDMWDYLEKGFGQVDVDFPGVEHLGTRESPEGGTALSVLRIGSTEEIEIMRVVCAVPVLVDVSDAEVKSRFDLSPSPYDLPDEFEEELESMN